MVQSALHRTTEDAKLTSPGITTEDTGISSSEQLALAQKGNARVIIAVGYAARNGGEAEGDSCVMNC